MALEEELKTEQVSHLDLSGFCQVGSGTAVRMALDEMRQHKVGVCLVIDGQTLQGILTERDVLAKIVAHPEQLNSSIESVMTAVPITVAASHSAVDALWLMDKKGIRNLPVLADDGRVLGVMTHQAIINYLAARYPIEILNRPPRPAQFPRKQEGGD